MICSFTLLSMAGSTSHVHAQFVCLLIRLQFVIKLHCNLIRCFEAMNPSTSRLSSDLSYTLSYPYPIAEEVVQQEADDPTRTFHKVGSAP